MNSMKNIDKGGESKEELSWHLDHLVLDDDDDNIGPPSKVRYFCFFYILFIDMNLEVKDGD